MKKMNPIPQMMLDLGLSLFDSEYSQMVKFDTRAVLRILQQEYADLKLSATDWKIVAGLFAKLLLGEKYLSTTDLLGGIFGAPQAILRHLGRVARLLETGILDAQELRGDGEPFGPNLRLTQGEGEDGSLSLVWILEMHLCLSNRVLRRFLGEDTTEDAGIQPYPNNEEYLRDWFHYLDLYLEYRRRKHCGSSKLLRAAKEEMEEWERRIERRCACTDKVFPLQDMIQEYSLDRAEQILLIYLLKEDLAGNSCTLDALLNLISEDKFDQQQKSRYLDLDGRLVRNGLVEVIQNQIFNTFFGELKLGPGVSKRLLGENLDGGVSSYVTNILSGSDLLKLEQPQEDFSNLILPESIKKTLVVAMGECRKDIGGILQSWGFGSVSPGAEAAFRRPALLMLFYGPPGTGKTFAARSFARELGKQLLVTDVSRLLSCWVGESEANVRRLFSLYEKIAQHVENSPVLLLNECDQFLTQRGYADRAADRMYNQMQNLFLEAFERFQGILIATTNLRGNLDPAFSRRFHLKLEFPLPDADCRLQLWRNHIPGALPLTPDVNLPALAQEYALTGGQIAVIVKNAALEAAMSGDKNRGVSMELLRKYIQIERSSSFGDGAKHSWGFSLPIKPMENRETEWEVI